MNGGGVKGADKQFLQKITDINDLDGAIRTKKWGFAFNKDIYTIEIKAKGTETPYMEWKINSGVLSNTINTLIDKDKRSEALNNAGINTLKAIGSVTQPIAKSLAPNPLRLFGRNNYYGGGVLYTINQLQEDLRRIYKYYGTEVQNDFRWLAENPETKVTLHYNQVCIYNQRYSNIPFTSYIKIDTDPNKKKEYMDKFKKGIIEYYTSILKD
jgi:hypothetical protein